MERVDRAINIAAIEEISTKLFFGALIKAMKMREPNTPKQKIQSAGLAKYWYPIITDSNASEA